MLMSERWKEIKGYRETYMVSDHGNVKPKTRPGARDTIVLGHELTKTENSNGYMRVSMRLADDPKSRSCFVHRLVAKSFIPEDESKPFVNHLDGNKHNNHASNLEWCSKRENELHAHRIGIKKATPLKGEQHGGRKFNWSDVQAIRREYIKGSKDHGQCALARKYNTSQSHIHLIVTNQNWKTEEK